MNPIHAKCSVFLASVILSTPLACDSGQDDATSQSSEWREQATEINDLTCERLHECFQDSQVDALQRFVPQMGASVDECKQNMRERNADANAACPSGQSFHSKLADQCIVALLETSCQDFLMSLLTSGGPDSCSTVCS